MRKKVLIAVGLAAIAVLSPVVEAVTAPGAPDGTARIEDALGRFDNHDG